MTGTVELAADGSHLVVRFPYREDLLAAVRELPGRRWDPKQKLWRIPTGHVELVYATFVRHLFEFAPEVTGLLAGTLGSKPKAATAASDEDRAPADRADALPATGRAEADLDAAAEESLSISALNLRVRDALRGQFPQRFWVVGELVDYDKQQERQHKFFSLVEKAPGEARPRARVEAALFERTAQELQARLQGAAADLQLRDGIEIRALVRVDLYVQSGRFQVVIEDIDPSFTLGKLALTREQILRELRDRGLVDRNRSLPLPVPPLRIGVLASPESDGWNDFVRHLEESRIGFAVTLLPVKVQGRELRPGMLAGLAWFAAHADEFDVLCVLRGGGSRTDLAWFDDLELAVAVAQHPLKILVGIGHQRDQSVLDVIAQSEKTPTAVAERLVGCVVQARRDLARQAVRLQAGVGRALARANAQLGDAAAALRQTVAARLAHERLRLLTASRDLDRGTARTLASARRDLTRAARDLRGHALLHCERTRSTLRHTAERCSHGAQRALERAEARLEQQLARHRLLDPRAVLRRGFAIVRTADGRVLPEAARVVADQRLELQLRDGTVRARAESVHPT